MADACSAVADIQARTSKTTTVRVEMLKLIQTSLVSWETLIRKTAGLVITESRHLTKPRSSKPVPPSQY